MYADLNSAALDIFNNLYPGGIAKADVDDVKADAFAPGV
jgi:hypothetical protein